MSIENFISGSILEFKIPSNLGYGYCKILDYRNIRSFDGVLVKVFDYITKESLNDINILQERNWLFGARRMPGLPGTRGKGAWKFKGVFIAEDDKIIPDFKYCIKNSITIDDLSKIEPWSFVRNLNKYFPSKYENIKHLEDTVLTPTLGIEIRTGMEYCRINNLDIGKYFDLSNLTHQIIIKQMTNVPIFKTIPKGYRGIARE